MNVIKGKKVVYFRKSGGGGVENAIASDTPDKFTLLLRRCLCVAVFFQKQLRHFFIDSREEYNYQLCIYTHYSLSCGQLH